MAIELPGIKKPVPKGRVFLSYENKLSCRQQRPVNPGMLQPITVSKLHDALALISTVSANRIRRPANVRFIECNVIDHDWLPAYTSVRRLSNPAL